jgi:hypothetical protein
MFFSTVVLNGGSTPLMHPEMPFRRIMFSTFFPRASFHTAWVIHDRVEPGPAMSAFPRLRPIFCGVAKFRDVPLPNLVELQGDMLS